MKKRYILCLVLCILVVFSSLSLFSCNTEPQGKNDGGATEATVKAVRVKVDVNKGVYLKESDIELYDANESTLPEGYVNKLVAAIGRETLVALSAGDTLTSDMLGDRKSTAKTEQDKTVVDKTLARKLGYVVVTDFLDANTGEDLSSKIQKIIDDNPRRTIYFPDGVYTIAYPIKTSSNSHEAVSLHLSANAVIKAADAWKARSEYMIQLGVLNKTFTIDATGTNYYMYGGVVDGNSKAKAVALEGGRETSVRYVTIKNAVQGFYIAHNEAYGSNDSDTEWLTIEGCGYAGSVGVLVNGLDNTLSNIRVSGFDIGVQLNNPGNLMHNIHTSYTGGEMSKYEGSMGFQDSSGGNWYDGCTSEDYETAFYATGGSLSLYNDCRAYWNEALGAQTAVRTNGGLSATFTNLRADFSGGATASLLVTASEGGKGIIKDPIFDTSLNTNDTYKKYLVGKVVWADQ